jgi:retinol dehydrogenase 12
VSVSHLVITGASTGIGRATVAGLAGEFARITLIGRSAERHGRVLDDLRSLGRDPRHIECDLSSLRSVSQAAATVEGSVEVLIANAGVAGQRGVTEDGFELHFGVNHLAHHFLVTELAARITDRVLTVSSNAHFDATDLDLDRVRGATRSFTGLDEYRESKLANVWFGRQLAGRYGFASYVVHPGMVATDIWRRIPRPIRPLFTRRMSTPEEGAATSIWASREKGLESGGYFARSAPRTPSEVALDNDKARKLWERSQEWVEPFRRSRE